MPGRTLISLPDEAAAPSINTTPDMTQRFDSGAALADAVIERVGHRIVLGLPVGIGKGLHVADAMFDRVARDPALSLTIFTGLTLEVPAGSSDLERRFLDPYVARTYGSWPVPKYAIAIRAGNLPDNIDVREFYLRPGAYLGNPLVQQEYTSINYSHVVGELQRLGVNVVAQLVSARPDSPGYYSLGSNPEITLDLLPGFAEGREAGQGVALIGEVNREMPYMTGDAELAEEQFDFLFDDATDYPLFGLPARPVAPADYATAMHVASTVPDGGTLQIGIGSLSDALAHCLRLRHERPEVFKEVLARLPGGSESARRASLPIHDGRFEQGLFAATELLSDALFALFEAGIVSRAADAEDPAVIHAGFFVGTAAFYERLRKLKASERARIRMTRISEVNTLFGDEQRKRAQRKDARFINETMMITLLGAAVSDSLDDGRVVSGVGGQFDFVKMAHDLEGARSLLMCRARRMSAGQPESNIRWSYLHTTVPRHYRDLFVSEYGIADTRGKPDRQVIDAVLSVADSEFQEALLTEAKNAGKLPADYQLPVDARNNTPEALAAVFAERSLSEHFPAYPLGTDFTATEQQLVTALQRLKTTMARPWQNLPQIISALTTAPADEQRQALERMSLATPATWREKFSQRLLAQALKGATQ